MKTAKSSQCQNRASSSAEFKRILVPIDFSEMSLTALPQAQLLAEKLGAELVLLHVIETYPIDHMVGLPESKQVHASLEDTAQAGLADLAADLGAGTRMLSAGGKPFQEIINAAEKLPADMIVLTTHGYTGIMHAYLGSTAERVVRHATCPSWS